MPIATWTCWSRWTRMSHAANRPAGYRAPFDPYPCPMDIVVYTPAEVKRRAQAPASLVATAFREGRIVYERN